MQIGCFPTRSALCVEESRDRVYSEPFEVGSLEEGKQVRPYINDFCATGNKLEMCHDADAAPVGCQKPNW